MTVALNKFTSDDVNRFWEKVDMSDGDGCWPWLAACDQDGYGLFSMRSTSVHATRVMWYVANGENPSIDAVVCHRCDNPATR